MRGMWQLQEAKNKLSEVVETALHEGPQRITRRGKDAVVVMSAKEYDRLKHGKVSLVDFLRKAPLRDLDLTRSKALPRDIEL